MASKKVFCVDHSLVPVAEYDDGSLEGWLMAQTLAMQQREDQCWDDFVEAYHQATGKRMSRKKMQAKLSCLFPSSGPMARWPQLEPNGQQHGIYVVGLFECDMPRSLIPSDGEGGSLYPATPVTVNNWGHIYADRNPLWQVGLVAAGENKSYLTLPDGTQVYPPGLEPPGIDVVGNYFRYKEAVANNNPSCAI